MRFVGINKIISYNFILSYNVLVSKQYLITVVINIGLHEENRTLSHNLIYLHISDCSVKISPQCDKLCPNPSGHFLISYIHVFPTIYLPYFHFISDTTFLPLHSVTSLSWHPSHHCYIHMSFICVLSTYVTPQCEGSHTCSGGEWMVCQVFF